MEDNDYLTHSVERFADSSATPLMKAYIANLPETQMDLEVYDSGYGLIGGAD